MFLHAIARNMKWFLTKIFYFVFNPFISYHNKRDYALLIHNKLNYKQEGEYLWEKIIKKLRLKTW